MSNQWPSNVLVGYVAAYGSTIPPNVTTEMITEALANHYTVLVYSFASIDPANKVVLPGGVTNEELKKQVKAIHDNNALALISFGGEQNTFTPNPSNPREAAEQIVAFCQQHSFDGIDLDLEHIEVDQNYLEKMIDAIRTLDSSLYLVAAPQIAGGYGGPASLAPMSIFSKSFLEAARFDALFIQEYNQFGGAVFDGLQDTDIGFISASFEPLTQYIPAGTKIVVGEPASPAAGSGLSNPADIVKDLQSGNVLKNSQYGGLMTWNINVDSQQKWSFARGAMPVTGL